MRPEVIIIVAYNKNLIIGNNLGKVPWHLPEDLKFFKEMTMGHPCIMGRKTWDTIPEKYRPLPGRFNVVISRNQNLQFTGDKVVSCNEIYSAITIAEQLDGGEKIFITGGGQIYRYCLEHNLVDSVLASEIHNHLDVEGGTFFPDLKQLGWTGTVFKEFAGFTVMKYKRNDNVENQDYSRAAGSSYEDGRAAHGEVQEQ